MRNEKVDYIVIERKEYNQKRDLQDPADCRMLAEGMSYSSCFYLRWY